MASQPPLASCVTSGLQEMLDKARAQRKAEVLAMRLALLHQQEARVTHQTETTKSALQDLALRKEEQERRIHEKEEALRKMHQADAFYHEHGAAHKAPAASQPSAPVVTEDDALARLANSSGLQMQAATPRMGTIGQA